MATIEQTPSTTALFSNTSNTKKMVSWGAVFSGVFIAAALYLLLLILGTGLGLTLSPWNFRGYDASTIGLVTAFWMILTQIVSSGAGGYIAGRLTPSDSSNGSNDLLRGTRFYHAAHGLVVWAISSIALAFLLGTAASNILSGTASAISSVGKGTAMGAGALLGSTMVGGMLTLPNSNNEQSSDGYYGDEYDIFSYAIDSLFRPRSSDIGSDDQRMTPSTLPRDSNAERREIVRIFISSIQKNQISDADKKYVAHLVSERTGMSQAESIRRVDETLEQLEIALDKLSRQTKEALDDTRSAAATAALLSFATLLGGAFFAVAMAIYGGNWQRRVRALEPSTKNGNENRNPP